MIVSFAPLTAQGVTMEIHTMQGKLVERAVAKNNRHTVALSTDHLPSGVYTVTAEVDNQTVSKKCIITR